MELGGQTAILARPLRYEFPLQPGAVRRVVVPVRVRALAPASMLVVAIGGSGSAPGRRLRLDRGHEYVSPGQALGENLVGALALAVVGVGAFRLGSNGRVRVLVDPDLPAAQVERAPTVELVSQPTPDELERAARS